MKLINRFQQSVLPLHDVSKLGIEPKSFPICIASSIGCLSHGGYKPGCVVQKFTSYVRIG